MDTARSSIPAVLLSATLSVSAEVVHFDGDPPGRPPADWLVGKTGSGSPSWAVEADPSAPSRPNVLRQSGAASFAWAVKPGALLADGFVEVKFRPLSGRQDQAGGVVWRWKDGDNYYVARANALENNVSLYYTERGTRRTLKYVDAPVPRGVWQTLRVEFAGTNVKVFLDGVKRIDLDDAHIAGPGAVGVWTKADSVTLFDDFGFGPPAAR